MKRAVGCDRREQPEGFGEQVVPETENGEHATERSERGIYAFSLWQMSEKIRFI